MSTKVARQMGEWMGKQVDERMGKWPRKRIDERINKWFWFFEFWGGTWEDMFSFPICMVHNTGRTPKAQPRDCLFGVWGASGAGRRSGDESAALSRWDRNN